MAAAIMIESLQLFYCVEKIVAHPRLRRGLYSAIVQLQRPVRL